MTTPMNMIPSNVPSGADTMSIPPLDAKGFFRSLYDFQFVSLVASRWLKLLYKIGVIFYTVMFGILILLCLTRTELIPGAIFLVPVYFIWLIGFRILIECAIVFFKLGADVHAIRFRGVAPASQAVVDAMVAIPATVEPAKTPPGWYDAPGDSAQLRYWDGKVWTEHHSPKASTQPT